MLKSIQKWSPWARHKYDRSARWTTNCWHRPRKWNYDNTRLTLRFHTLETYNINTGSFLVKDLWICEPKEISLRVSNEIFMLYAHNQAWNKIFILKCPSYPLKMKHENLLIKKGGQLWHGKIIAKLSRLRTPFVAD